MQMKSRCFNTWGERGEERRGNARGTIGKKEREGKWDKKRKTRREKGVYYTVHITQLAGERQ